jgi:hypothetical protein
LFCVIWDYKTSGDLQKYFMSWEKIRKSSIWIIPGTTGLYLGIESPNIFGFVPFGIISFKETLKKKLMAGRSAGNLQSIYSLRNWLVLGSESQNIFGFVPFGIKRL